MLTLILIALCFFFVLTVTIIDIYCGTEKEAPWKVFVCVCMWMSLVIIASNLRLLR